MRSCDSTTLFWLYSDRWHQPRRNPIKVFPVLPARILLAYQSNVSFMYQGSRLQGVALTFLSQVTNRKRRGTSRLLRNFLGEPPYAVKAEIHYPGTSRSRPGLHAHNKPQR